MSEVIVKFEGEGLEGVVAVGSYLNDVAKRFGIRVEGDCSDPETDHECVMKVSDGKELMSTPTQTEMEQLSSQTRRNGERLACQTKIEKPGEVTIMSVKKKQEEPKVEEKSEGYKKEFEAMPLEKKIASLVELEAIALGETFSYVLDSPYKAMGKVVDVMAGFGFNLEKADREAKRPDEHKEDEPKETDTKGGAKKKRPAKKTAAKTAAKKTTRKRRAVKKTEESKTEEKETE